MDVEHVEHEHTKQLEHIKYFEHIEHLYRVNMWTILIL